MRTGETVKFNQGFTAPSKMFRKQAKSLVKKANFFIFAKPLSNVKYLGQVFSSKSHAVIGRRDHVVNSYMQMKKV